MTDFVPISVTRIGQFADRLRRYDVRIDDTSIGALDARGTLTAMVSPGEHRLRVHIDWCASQPLRFHARPGIPLSFRCGNRLRGWRILLAGLVVLLRPNDYLWLAEAGDDSRSA